MDILIKNMELPKEGSITITIRHDGVINFIGDMGSNLGRLVDSKAIELPPHGELIDRQAVLSYFETGYLMGANMDYEDIDAIVRNPKAIPTVLEAST